MRNRAAVTCTMDGYGELVQTYDGGDDEDDDYSFINSKVPWEVREEMLARVSCVTQLLRLRLVCKSWNSLISSQTLAKLHAQISYQQRQPWLLVARRRLRASSHGGLNIMERDRRYCSNYQELLYLCKPNSMANDRWIAPPLPFLSRSQFIPCDLLNCRSNGGLVCCIASRPPSQGRGKAVLIFNPLTRAYKFLPVPICFAGLGRSCNNSASLDMVMCRNRSTGHFRVAVCDTVSRDVRVFDSRNRKWIVGCRPPVSSTHNDQNIASNIPVIKPRFQGYRCADDELFWYDLEENAWLSATLPSLDIVEHDASRSYRNRSTNSASCSAAIATSHKMLLKCPTVFKDDDGAVMLAAVLVHPTRGLQGFGVWRLNMQMDYWSLVSRTPASLLRGSGKLHRLNDSGLVCHPNYVCMTGLLRMSVCPWKCFYPWILAFDAAHGNKWTWAPAHPLGHKTWANFQVVSVVDPNLQSIP